MASRVPIRHDRALLNPKFEGYKLSFLDESHQQFVQVDASGPGVVVPKVPHSAKLSYRQIQARIRHNHLYPGWNSFKTVNGDSSNIRNGVLFIIDDSFTLIALQFDQTSRRLRSKRLLQLPRPVVPLNFILEFPSVKPVSPDYIFVSDGAATFYLVQLAFTGMEYEATLVASTKFQSEENADELMPCQLLEAKAFPINDSNGANMGIEIKFIVYYAAKDIFYSSGPSPHYKADKKTVFIVSLCSIVVDRSITSSRDTAMDLGTDGGNAEAPIILPFQRIHSIRGTEVPFYCALDPSNEGYVIGSNTNYKSTKEPPVGQTNRSLEPGSEAMELDNTDIGVVTRPEPSYIWTQTDTELTLCFKLPRGTTKHAVNCKFARQDLHLQVNLSQPSNPAIKLPNLENIPLFDEVLPNECFWTLESASGVLTLTLEKKHTKTRWTQVFSEDVDTDPVEESLDPSMFAEYKSALEKYTTENYGAEPGRELTVLPSLTQDPQEDIDEEGEEIKFSWVQSEDGADIIRATTIGTGHDWIGQAFSSFENHQGLAGSQEIPFRMPTVCLKHDVDGLVYSIQHVPGSASTQSTILQLESIMRFLHVSTFDALAFVQASKREKRFVMHDPHGKFAVIVESSRNVYIYSHTVDSKLKQEKQIVVDVSKGQQVDIIGCQLISDNVLVILMEGKHGALVLDLSQ
ncbi:hypothetical protein BX616_010405 [Lobosporangium transversale]|uniref:NudC domain-containing protein 1 n=1 Tax=Lobosporangium transversale TaxID=64571 RepID=A0A1Y2GNI3_9FUNG|nr:hypothetical protein BCR41DRAFT_396640 [Lobosporangium transversale]KAF9912130.1 hypothetical protein BX616_010405 [Lobosporangium transversale]ORZ14917.1 hypothetical protein BCR41DRAFT_396640 [Lobosporangium transversale]|eukprot:XP_021881049.1 hypothetical protein BCR41DRAFT_396640 [Lobosporangium transversale]